MDNSSNQKKILLIEDEAELRMVLRTYFKMKGYIVDDTNSPLVALEKIRKEKYAVVISDNRMPGISGLSLIPSIKSSGAKLILMSGYFSPEQVIQAKKEGADAILAKPIPPGVLDKTLFDLFYADDPMFNEDPSDSDDSKAS